MELKIVDEVTVDDIEIGDIFIFGGTPYMLIRERKNDTSGGYTGKYNLLNISGVSYYSGSKTIEEIKSSVKYADAHYSNRNYYLKLERKK